MLSYVGNLVIVLIATALPQLCFSSPDSYGLEKLMACAALIMIAGRWTRSSMFRVDVPTILVVLLLVQVPFRMAVVAGASVPAVAHLGALLMSPLVLTSVSEQGGMLIWGMEGLLEFRPGVEVLAVPQLCSALVAVLMLRGKQQNLAGTTSIVLMVSAMIVLRFCLIAQSLSEQRGLLASSLPYPVGVYFDPWTVFPFALLLAASAPPYVRRASPDKEAK